LIAPYRTAENEQDQERQGAAITHVWYSRIANSHAVEGPPCFQLAMTPFPVL
jgi:hypothetical protein